MYNGPTFTQYNYNNDTNIYPNNVKLEQIIYIIFIESFQCIREKRGENN